MSDPAGLADTDSFRDPAVLADPYPYYDFLREQGPLCRYSYVPTFMLGGLSTRHLEFTSSVPTTAA